MKLFQLNFVTLMLRFYLLMGIVIVAFFAGMPFLSILALPVFFSALMGLQISKTKRSPEAKPSSQMANAYTQHQAIQS